MTIKSLVISSFKNLKRNLSRCILTMIGIVIGIASVITIVAIGEAYKDKTIKAFTGESEGKVILNTTFTPSNNINKDDELYFVEKDGDVLRDKNYIDSFGFLYDNQNLGTMTNIKVRDVKVEGMIGGFEETDNENIIGRNLKKIDNDRIKNVAVVNESIFPENSKINEYLGNIISINNINYEIVGIIPSMETEKTSFLDLEENIKIPEKTYKKLNENKKTIYGIQITLKKDVNIKEAMSDIEKSLNERGSKKDLGKYEVFDSTGAIDLLGSVLNTITTFIAIVAGISLFIAGIGVMNMIYTSVSERTLEIGIKRALGAKRKDIEREFLFEGIMITLSGGVIGYIIGILIAIMISYFLKVTVKVSLTTMILASSISIIIGISSSIFPAKKAANQNTIEILQ